MQIRWKVIPGFPGYMVSDQGTVRSTPSEGSRRSGNILKHEVTSRGYHYVGLYPPEGGRQPTRKKVSVLVLEAFVGPRPEGLHACHRDDDRDNDTLDNLYWGTPKQNQADLLRNGKNYFAAKDTCKHGHSWTPENTYIRPDIGTRQCIQCGKDRRQRMKEAGAHVS